MKKLVLSMLAAVVMLTACGKTGDELTISGLNKEHFVSEVEGHPTALYVLTNDRGMEVCITNYGGRIVSVMVPDKNGKMTDVVLGYDKISDYLASDGNFGAIIGRYGNRIANASFSLDSVTYTLPKNDETNCLHGGPEGFHTKVWTAEQPDEKTLKLTYLSPDGEAGFPGNLHVAVTYLLTEENEIDIRYAATTDKPTVVNLTNHSYFNLSGVPGSQVLDHLIMINADYYTPVDSMLIPDSIAPVEGTPMDLRDPVALNLHIDSSSEQIVRGHGFDHNWVLNTNGDVTKLAAKAISPVSGIILEVYTKEPGIQFYSGNFMSGKDIGKQGVTYPYRGALCLETQHFPDSPNHPEFPTTELRPENSYESRCIYRFTIDK